MGKAIEKHPCLKCDHGILSESGTKIICTHDAFKRAYSGTFAHKNGRKFFDRGVPQWCPEGKKDLDFITLKERTENIMNFEGLMESQEINSTERVEIELEETNAKEKIRAILNKKGIKLADYARSIDELPVNFTQFIGSNNKKARLSTLQKYCAGLKFTAEEIMELPLDQLLEMTIMPDEPEITVTPLNAEIEQNAEEMGVNTTETTDLNSKTYVDGELNEFKGDLLINNTSIDGTIELEEIDTSEDENGVPILHQEYYGYGGIETLDYIEAKEFNFNLGSAVKYISRAGRKNGNSKNTDLKKAINYLQRELKRLGE